MPRPATVMFYATEPAAMRLPVALARYREAEVRQPWTPIRVLIGGAHACYSRVNENDETPLRLGVSPLD